MLKKARIQKKKVEPYWLYTPDFCWKGGVGWNTHMRTLNNTEWGGREPTNHWTDISTHYIHNIMNKSRLECSIIHLPHMETFACICLIKEVNPNWLPHGVECSWVTGHWLHRAGSSIMLMGKLTITKWGDTLHCTIGTHIVFIVQKILLYWLIAGNYKNQNEICVLAIGVQRMIAGELCNASRTHNTWEARKHP